MSNPNYMEIEGQGDDWVVEELDSLYDAQDDYDFIRSYLDSQKTTDFLTSRSFY